MSNRFNIPAPTPGETYDARQARQLAEFDHCHDTSILQHFMTIGAVQDAQGNNCAECGRTLNTRAADPWLHAFQCSSYEPHPNSIAGQPGYVIPTP